MTPLSPADALSLLFARPEAELELDGDRLRFHGRVFADSISGEVRVASVRPSSAPGHTIVGARFLELDRESIARVDRILSGGRGPAPEAPGGLSLAALRELAANAPVE